MTKLCIFDLDGTLINSLQDLANAMNHALQKNGFPVHPHEKYRQMVGSGISVLADRAVKNSTLPYDETIKAAILSDFSACYTDHCMDNTRPYEKIPQMLYTLRENGILCAVNSNKPDAFAKKIVRTLFPDAPFSEVFGKRDGFERKPSPDGAQSIMELLSCQKEECVYIGDSDVDVQTARNAGIAFCGVSWGFRSREELQKEGAAFIADDPDDIIRYVMSR